MSDTTTGARPPYAGTRYPRLAQIPAFRDFIAQGWDDVPTRPDLPAGTAQAAAAHRERLSAAMPGQTLVLSSGIAPVRNDDSSYGFRADSSFVWATGCQTEDATLVMWARPGGHDAVLYMPAPFRPGDDGFFSNALHGELWVGPSAGLAEWADELQVAVEPIEALPARAAELRG
uniref:aminopeptidase P N-terminal domain-containing protein n=1 Tax=Microbacterium sp. TaxID=51671 RepID=UPI0028998ABF